MLGKCGGGPAFDSRYGGAAAATACALLLGGSALLCHLAWRPTAGAEAVGFAVLYGLGYGGSFALVQSKAALQRSKDDLFAVERASSKFWGKLSSRPRKQHKKGSQLAVKVLRRRVA